MAKRERETQRERERERKLFGEIINVIFPSAELGNYIPIPSVSEVSVCLADRREFGDVDTVLFMCYYYPVEEGHSHTLFQK